MNEGAEIAIQLSKEGRGARAVFGGAHGAASFYNMGAQSIVGVLQSPNPCI